MVNLIAGLDEIATETQLSDGWCYFCIPETEYSSFKTEVKTLLAGTNKLTSFHGKKFVAGEANEYENFLRIIRKYAESSVPSILSCTLNSSNFQDTFVAFGESVTTNVFNQVGVTNQELIDITKRLTPGLFSFLRLTNHFGPDYQIKIEIDSDEIIKRYSQIDTEIKGYKFSANWLMTKLFNAYRNHQFPNSPIISENGISILKDQKSLLIQAADVIGNFSTSYVFYKLGNNSKKRILKGQIFEMVFGDKFGEVDFNQHVRLVGQNDLKLLQSGAFTMEFSAYYEPD